MGSPGLTDRSGWRFTFFHSRHTPGPQISRRTVVLWCASQPKGALVGDALRKDKELRRYTF